MFEDHVPRLIEITRAAGDAILEVYESDFTVQNKADESPLTQADLAAHAIIERELTALNPDIPILSEESVPPPFAERSRWPAYWLVDPLDGTKEFVSRNGEFTVNIAYIEQGEPVFGVVGVPVTGEVFVGDVKAQHAFCDQAGERQVLTTQPRDPQKPLVIVASRSHGNERLEAFISQLEINVGPVERRPVGSSLKLCIMAQGLADFYPRLSPTSEWDIGAAQAVLTAAGGRVWAAKGGPITYNQEESFLNPDFFAVADGAFDWESMLPPIPTDTDE